VVTAANVSALAEGRRYCSNNCKATDNDYNIYTDSTYQGAAFVRWAFDTYRFILETVLRRKQQAGSQVDECLNAPLDDYSGADGPWATTTNLWSLCVPDGDSTHGWALR